MPLNRDTLTKATMGKFRSRARTRRTRRTMHGSKRGKEKVIDNASSVAAANPSDVVTYKLDGDSCGSTVVVREEVEGDVYVEVGILAKKRLDGTILLSCIKESHVSYDLRSCIPPVRNQ